MSKIQWTEETWNPVTGCTRVSPGCQHCYAEIMARRLIGFGQPQYQGTIDKNGRWNGQLNFVETAIEKPMRRKQPTTYFVNSMSDLFHEAVEFEWLDRIWQVMSQTPQHTYQILTKRANLLPQRVRAMVDAYGVLPNVWIGVSVENQHYADGRIPLLSATPAAVRFLSCEPLLETLQIQRYLLDGYHKQFKPSVHWVIVGGESGPGARPFDPTWAIGIIRQCRNAGVAPFVKQLGSNPVGLDLKDSKGGDIDEWPEELQVREFPQPTQQPAAAPTQAALF